MLKFHHHHQALLSLNAIVTGQYTIIHGIVTEQTKFNIVRGWISTWLDFQGKKVIKKKKKKKVQNVDF